MKIIKADLTSLFFKSSFQIMNNEIPIIKYKTIHTGPKSQLGGLNEGLFNAVYHVGIASGVNITPINPAN